MPKGRGGGVGGHVRGWNKREELENSSKFNKGLFLSILLQNMNHLP